MIVGANKQFDQNLFLINLLKVFWGVYFRIEETNKPILFLGNLIFDQFKN